VNKTARTPTGKNVEPKDFESALAELEAIVARMEQADLPLETSLQAYKRGMELAAFCRRTLDTAEQQVKILEDGVFKDFHAEDHAGDDADN
jgi:exodeoxyribonuclease VII small subunit